MNEALSLRMGPSIMSLEASRETLTVPWVSRRLPSFICTSTTEERRPPNRAGKPPLVMDIFLTASALNTEKKPNRWLTL